MREGFPFILFFPPLALIFLVFFTSRFLKSIIEQGKEGLREGGNDGVVEKN